MRLKIRFYLHGRTVILANSCVYSILTAHRAKTDGELCQKHMIKYELKFYLYSFIMLYLKLLLGFELSNFFKYI